MTPEEAEKLLEDTVEKLGEHFDAVQVMGTWTEEGISRCCKRGAGNWYARQGMAHEFINDDIAETNAYRLAQHLDKE